MDMRDPQKNEIQKNNKSAPDKQLSEDVSMGY